MVKKDLASLKSKKWSALKPFKHFEIFLRLVLLIQITHCTDSVIKISTIKNYVDRALLSFRSVAFYNLINDVTHKIIMCR